MIINRRARAIGIAAVLVCAGFATGCPGDSETTDGTAGPADISQPDSSGSDGADISDTAQADTGVPDTISPDSDSPDSGSPDADSTGGDSSDAGPSDEPLTVCVLAEPKPDAACQVAEGAGFGLVPVGKRALVAVRFENPGSETVSVSAVTAEPSDLLLPIVRPEVGSESVVQLPTVVIPGGDLVVEVGLDAGAAPGPLPASLTLVVDGAPVTVPLSASIDGCPTGFDSCDDDWSTGCETGTLDNPAHCGGCFESCQLSDGKAECIAGQCVTGGCKGGFYGPECLPCPGAETGDACSGHGTCSDGPLGDGSCTCLAGWSGDVCDTDIDECAAEPGPCAEVAICENAAGTYECTCPDGYEGPGETCLGKLGTPCEVDGDCLDLCKDGVCASSGTNGSACLVDDDCLYGPCTDLDGDGTGETCGPPDGSTCAGPEDCASPWCGPGPDTMVCGACPVGTACSLLPLVSGVCPMACVAQDDLNTCRGDVAGGLCYGRDAPPVTHDEALIAGLQIVPIQVPSGVYAVGAEVPVSLTLTNPSPAPVTRFVKYKQPLTWAVDDASLSSGESFTLQPGESLTFTATLTALSPNHFDAWYSALTLVFETAQGIGASYAMYGIIGYEGQVESTTTCGGYTFPETWCPGNDCGDDGYFQSVCCDGVFYPGSYCCSDADCVTSDGACVDGYCVSRVPQFGGSNTLPLGHQRILVVFSDFSAVPGTDDVCENRAEELFESQHLQAVETWIDNVIAERTGREDKQLHIQWTVFAGLKASDYILDDLYHFSAFQKSVETWLIGQGCLDSFFEYDKVIVISNQIDINYGGQAFANGRIAMRYHNNEYLMIHELMHTFGARDTYLNIGDRFQYRGDLMGNYLSLDPVPTDGVMWGEIGLGDIDRNGIIDIYERSHYPEDIAVTGASATFTDKSTVEVTVKLSLIEDGHVFPLGLEYENIAIPDQGLGAVGWTASGDTVILYLTPDQEAVLQAAGELQLTISRTHLFTNAAFERETLSMSQTLTLPLE